MNDDLKRILVLILGLAALTVIFRVNGLDMKIESFFYDRVSSKWIFENNPLVEFSYKFGTVLPFLLGAFAVMALGMSFMNSGFSRYRKASLLFILTFLIGPGLFVNVIFKNYSGRPRPREVKEFGGRWDYREAFDFGTPGKGHSFPCGHASAGFMLIALYYSLRHKNQSQARAAMGIGLTYGGLWAWAACCRERILLRM
jgi:lipid A 4'-phosphatase